MNNFNKRLKDLIESKFQGPKDKKSSQNEARKGPTKLTKSSTGKQGLRRRLKGDKPASLATRLANYKTGLRQPWPYHRPKNDPGPTIKRSKKAAFKYGKNLTKIDPEYNPKEDPEYKG